MGNLYGYLRSFASAARSVDNRTSPLFSATPAGLVTWPWMLPDPTACATELAGCVSARITSSAVASTLPILPVLLVFHPIRFMLLFLLVFLLAHRRGHKSPLHNT